MIVPTTRLLVWVTWIGVPFAVLLATVPEAALLSWAVVAGLVLIAVLDAWKSGAALAGIAVQSAPIVRMQKDNQGLFPLEFHNETATARALRVGIAFPSVLAPEREELDAMLPADSLVSKVELPCRPSKRGQYSVTLCVIEAQSPLGFWSRRRRCKLQSEVRVYPNLMDERRRVAALFLNRGRYGLHTQRLTGKGREFEKVRDYVAGDSIEDIHWKASAKRGRPVTKVFQIERTQEVIVVLDASRFGMLRGADGNTAFERFVSTALILALATRQQGDNFGLVVFADRLLRFLPPRSGKNHFQVCRDMLYSLEASAVAPDFHEIATTIRLRLRKRALLVFLTSLADPATSEAFMKSVPPLCREHLLVVNMIRPPSANPLFADGLPVTSTEEIYDRLGGHLIWLQLEELKKQLQREGVTLSLFDHERLAAQVVTQYLELKARQLL